MDVASLQSLYKATPSTTVNTTQNVVGATSGDDFGSVFSSALNLVNETNSLQIVAQNQEIKFAMGEAVNTHDLAIAQQKANIALQYTVAVRDRFISAYQEIMQMQI